MERVVNQLILQSQNQARRISSLEFITEKYHEWKKETKSFTKFVRDKVEELDKNRAGNDLSNERQEKVSK